MIAWPLRTVFVAVVLSAGGWFQPVGAQSVPRQFSDDEIGPLVLETCRNGPERKARSGEALVQSFIQLGWRNVGQGRPLDAAESFVLAANAGPERPDIYWGMGVAAHLAGFPTDHLAACFVRVQRMLPDEPGPFADHGRALEERGEYEDAIAKFDEALQRDEAFRVAHVGLAKAYAKVGNTELSIYHAQEADRLSGGANR